MFYHLTYTLISLFTFFGFYFYNNKSVILSSNYQTLFGYYFFVSLLFQFYYRNSGKSFRKNSYDKFLQFIFTLFTLSMIFSYINLDNISRLFIFQIVIANVVLQWLISFPQSFTSKNLNQKPKLKVEKLLTSFIALCFSFFIILFYKVGTIKYYNWMEYIAPLLLANWWLSSYITRKFYVQNSKNIYYKLGSIIKSQVLFLLFSSAMFYFFKFDYFSRQLYFGTIILFSIIEFSIFILVFKSEKEEDSLLLDGFDADQRDFPPSKFILSDSSKPDYSYIVKKLSSNISNHAIESIIKIFRKLNFHFIENDFTILSTNNSKNFQFSSKQSQKLIFNLSKINNYKSINKMFYDISKIIVPGGYFIGVFTPLEEDYIIMREKMPRFLFILIYPIHFIFYRMFPKLPLFKHIYKVFNRDNGTYISKAEVFGRLNYFGFKIIESFTDGHKTYFISSYAKTKSQEKNPSFGPLVKLNRISLNREIITIYKFRTMHPYSEFLQSDLYKTGELSIDGNKIIDDYRVTAYGKVLRKFWIDEIPQIINWIRGDVSLVGVRALSRAKFSLYSPEIQELRTKLKPGLIPPFYADMPESFEELMESEKKYILKKLESRFSTDFLYFFRVVYNILFKGARSQ